MDQKKIVIIGAGPTGLGAAHRLHELGYQNWVMYEKSDGVGGHSCSHVDSKGFVWDEGGHVIFSHYKYFDDLIDKMLGREVHERIRESWIVKEGAWVPYPFQSNLRYLPKDVQVRCLVGAAKAASNGAGKEAANFREPMVRGSLFSWDWNGAANGSTRFFAAVVTGDQDIEGRHNEQREQGADRNSAENHQSHRKPRNRACARCQ